MKRIERTLTAFRLSAEEFRMLDYLADQKEVTRSAMLRLLIKRSYGRKLDAAHRAESK